MLKSPIHRPEEEREFEQFTTETGRLFFRRPAKQSLCRETYLNLAHVIYP